MGLNKIYVNITNHCNVACPFCCMYSDSTKNRFLSFDKLYELFKGIKEPTIIQFEGGEPLTHPHFILFLEYAASLKDIHEIVIDTNAFLLNKVIDKIVDISERYQKTITIKPSYNRYLQRVYDETHPIKFVDYLKNLITSCEFLDYVKFKINVRGSNEKEITELETELGDLMKDYIVSFLFNSYGRLTGNENYAGLTINKVYDNWFCVNSAGENFGQDLIARSESEK